MLTYELRLGITGHRDLADPPAIADAIRRLLDRIDGTLRHQAVVPLSWTVVSALARGADRLFAEAVLANKQGRLEVVTPFPVADYVRDFDAERDREEFDRLISTAKQVDELPGKRGTRREAAYLRAGRNIVDTCEIVVAVWNGRASSGGGTGDVVEYATKHDRLVLWIDADHADNPVRVIRSVAYGTNGRLAEACWDEFPRTVKALSLGYHQQVRYCLDPAVSEEECAAECTRQRDRLLNAAQAAGLELDLVAPLLGESIEQFVRADMLAQYYRRRHRWLIAGVLYLAAAAVTVAVGQVLFSPDRPRLILIEIVTMVLVLALWWWGTRQAWHEKWRHDRYFAERLRVATFAALVGNTPRSAGRSDPLPFYQGPQHWLTQAVDVLTRAMSPQSVPFEPLKRFIVTEWFEDQRTHHARGAARKARAVRRRHRYGAGLFSLTLLMAVLHFAGVGHAQGPPGTVRLRLDVWITFLALVLPAWAGAIHADTSQLELERLAERSAQMARVLDRTVCRAKSATSIDELREVFRDAEALMANETREWWVLLGFQRPHLHV